jgi:hypothetical protein
MLPGMFSSHYQDGAWASEEWVLFSPAMQQTVWLGASGSPLESLLPGRLFIPRYFIVFETIANGTDSLISFSVCSLLVYRKFLYVNFISCSFAERVYDF